MRSILALKAPGTSSASRKHHCGRRCRSPAALRPASEDYTPLGLGAPGIGEVENVAVRAAEDHQRQAASIKRRTIEGGAVGLQPGDDMFDWLVDLTRPMSIELR